MKKTLLWKILLIVGIIPFIIPFVMSFTRASSWTMLDWLILYSFVYWPTYVVGLGLIILAAYKLLNNHDSKEGSKDENNSDTDR